MPRLRIQKITLVYIKQRRVRTYDTADLAVGAYADEPTLLVKQTISRGKTLTSLHDFRYTRTGAVTTPRVTVACIIKIQKGIGLETTLLRMVCSSKTNSLTLSEVQNEEVSMI